MKIETDRLILRKWEIKDDKSMFKYASNKEVGPMAGWPAHDSIETSRKIIKELINHPYCFAICLKEDIDNPIGCVELKTTTDMSDKKDEYELGYWIGMPYWGNGFAGEASNALIKYGFEDINLSAIWCGYYDGNIKSKRVQEKLGFVYHHTTNDVYVSAMKETRIGHANILTKEIKNKRN